ncbi:MAG TPA: ParB/RepB/Spo0J family partition protein, partial [Phenylobacterium sp.]|nr:ParB/RepB/Spo0J family partition protein [Phenylobacterium sp.]
QSNVRRIKAGVSIEELAEDIARRTLLQSLTVRPVIDAAGNETGFFEIPAGGRRYRALERLVAQKRLAKTAPVPCIVRTDGLAEEDSLAENVQRAPLHPLDQFRAFQALRDKGQGEEEIAAAFFVSVGVVRQRLRLAAVSPKLLEAYAEDALSLDQLMAFTVSADHARQEQVFERLRQSVDRTPFLIRRLLTERVVRADDRRAQFIGLEAYVEAGGAILNDLFQDDHGGWLQDVDLLEHLVAEKLEGEAETVRREGWKWVEVGVDFPYGHTYGLRQILGEPPEPTPEEAAARDALQAEYAQLEASHADFDDLPEDVDLRLGELETALEAIEARSRVFAGEDKAIAGVFISLDSGGRPRLACGYVRPEDELVTAGPAGDENDGADGEPQAAERRAADADSEAGADADDELRPISERLLAELTAHRTVALRHALGERPDVAFLAVLHRLVLQLCYAYASGSCLDLDVKCASLAAQAPGLGEAACAMAVERRHQAWLTQLPKSADELWDALLAFDSDSREALFAHCAALSLNAVVDPNVRRPKAVVHADRLAEVLALDLAAAGWTPTAASFLGRVAKPGILQAVREARGDLEAAQIAHLKKADMVDRAEALLTGTGWLPEPLRTPGRPASLAPAGAPDGQVVVCGQPEAASDAESALAAAE